MKIVKYIIIVLVIVAIITPFGVVGYYLKNYDFDLSSLLNYKPATTTRIYDKNGVKIANVFDKKHRFYAPFNEIPPRVIEALLAIEDTSFFEHHGLNVDAIMRAILKDIKAGKMVEGASTITQQLVKNVLLTREKKISRKIKELIYSFKLEQTLTKEQILELYLNEIYYGHGYYGIKTAADGYFHKKLSDLTLKEIAILVGLPKAPSTYNPTKNYDISMGRANRVIGRMHTLGWIDDATYEHAVAENPKVYNDTLTQNKAPFVVDEVLRRVKKMGIDDVKTGGYNIYTTIDLSLQKAARESLEYAYKLALKRNEQYRKHDKHFAQTDANDSQLNGAIVSIDSKTGDILALVGSVDYEKNSYNRASQGKRQPGSAFKPFIYQVAINLGYSGATQLVDVAKTYKYRKNGKMKKWRPKNYEHDYKGLVTLREALVHSRNLATINLVNDIGLDALITQLTKFRIKNLPHDLSLSLGTMSLSPLELAQYYTLFSNYGTEVETHLIRSIEQNGQTLYERKIVTYDINKPTQAYIMTTILQDIVKRGTGVRARARGIELAGKTGTTNNSVDGWFAGFSPTITTVVWFGNDDNKPMYKKETGGRIAGPAFSSYYTKLIKLYPQTPRHFKQPKGIMKVKIGGRTEYFSNISKPPRVEAVPDAQEELVF